MPRTLRQIPTVVLQFCMVCLCGIAIWNSSKLLRADYLFHQDSDESIRGAIQLAPDQWVYYLRLAQLEPDRAPELLTRSLQLNNYNATADIELGLNFEAAGDTKKAEQLLLAAFQIDRTYLPRWSLANFYFRSGDMPNFWVWARRAAEMPGDQIGALFALCFRATDDPFQVTHELLNDDPKFLRQYLGFLLKTNEYKPVSLVASHLIQKGDQADDLPILLYAVSILVVDDDADGSTALWHQLSSTGWVPADNSLLQNSSFVRDPMPVAFDWTIPDHPGMNASPGPSGLVTEFRGNQPEDCVIAEQLVALKPGTYTFRSTYHTSGIPPDNGIRWEIMGAKSLVLFGSSRSLSSENSATESFSFTIPGDSPFVRVRLHYQRPIGTTRVSGTLVIESSNIQMGSQT